MKRILIIEDDPRIAKALAIRLKHCGYEVVTAADGLQGLKSAIEVKPDLIVSDIWMPGSVGFPLARRKRSSASIATAERTRDRSKTPYSGSLDTNVFVRSFKTRQKSSPNYRIVRLWLIEKQLQRQTLCNLAKNTSEDFDNS